MKTEDFNRLKAVCEKEGFEIGFKYDESTYTVRLKKDILEGVEFVIPNHNSTASKLPYKVVNIKNGFVQVYCPYSGNGDIGQMQESELNPSTESAYIEQLKAECFKRFGEIKEGDRFEDINEIISIVSGPKPTFIYNKEYDQLFYGQVTLYQAGKWATRVKERVKVEGIHSSGAEKIKPEWNYMFEFKISDLREDAKTMHHKVLPFLASKLEEYLNKE